MMNEKERVAHLPGGGQRHPGPVAMTSSLPQSGTPAASRAPLPPVGHPSVSRAPLASRAPLPPVGHPVSRAPASRAPLPPVGHPCRQSGTPSTFPASRAPLAPVGHPCRQSGTPGRQSGTPAASRAAGIPGVVSPRVGGRQLGLIPAFPTRRPPHFPDERLRRTSQSGIPEPPVGHPFRESGTPDPSRQSGIPAASRASLP